MVKMSEPFLYGLTMNQHGLHREESDDIMDGDEEAEMLRVSRMRAKQTSNIYANLERAALRKGTVSKGGGGDHSGSSDVECRKLTEWMEYIQQQSLSSGLNQGALCDIKGVSGALSECKKLLSRGGDVEPLWLCFMRLNAVSIVCDLATTVLHGDASTWNKVLLGVLDVVALYANWRRKQRRSALQSEYSPF